eukprot:gene24887-biopygen10276
MQCVFRMVARAPDCDPKADNQSVDELVVDSLVDEHSGGGSADLSLVEEDSDLGGGDGTEQDHITFCQGRSLNSIALLDF